MREFSKVSPRFWTGETGREIRKLGLQSQVIAFYLFTCPNANMLGLYYLALPTLCHETGSPLQGALEALRSLREVKFAYYDEPSEHVWVPNMAREQIGERLKPRDNRHVAVLKELEQLRKVPFFNDFVIRYRDAFELQNVELNPEIESPLEAPSKPLTKPLRSQEQEQEQDKEQEQESELSVDPKLSTANGSKPADSEIPSEAVDRIFVHWQSVHDHKTAKLDPKRRKLIREALKLYGEDELCRSLSGYKNSPHHMGQNDHNTVYDSIELLLKDAKRIDAGLRFFDSPPRTDLSAQTRRIIDQTADWMPPEMRNAGK